MRGMKPPSHNLIRCWIFDTNICWISNELTSKYPIILVRNLMKLFIGYLVHFLQIFIEYPKIDIWQMGVRYQIKTCSSHYSMKLYWKKYLWLISNKGVSYIWWRHGCHIFWKNYTHEIGSHVSSKYLRNCVEKLTENHQPSNFSASRSSVIIIILCSIHDIILMEYQLPYFTHDISSS